MEDPPIKFLYSACPRFCLCLEDVPIDNESLCRRSPPLEPKLVQVASCYGEVIRGLRVPSGLTVSLGASFTDLGMCCVRCLTLAHQLQACYFSETNTT